MTVDYAKADPTDLCMRISVENRGPDPASLHVLPTLWFRNTWAWGLPGQDAVPRISADGDGTLLAEHAQLGSLVLIGEPGGTPLLCDNESNAERLWGVPGRSAYPKDGINDHVVHGSPTVNPDRIGTKGALWYRLDVPAGGTSVLRVRLSAGTAVAGEAGLDSAFDAVIDAPPGGGRRLLRRTHSREEQRRRSPRAPSGAGGDAVGQAVLPLRRRALARRRPGRTTSARPPAHGAQRRLAPPQQRRRDLDAGPVGVPRPEAGAVAGATSRGSTSTSTATPARVWARATRPAGPVSSPSFSCTA